MGAFEDRLAEGYANVRPEPVQTSANRSDTATDVPTTPTGKRLAHINDDAGFIEDCYLIDTDDIIAIEQEAAAAARADANRLAEALRKATHDNRLSAK